MQKKILISLVLVLSLLFVTGCETDEELIIRDSKVPEVLSILDEHIAIKGYKLVQADKDKGLFQVLSEQNLAIDYRGFRETKTGFNLFITQNVKSVSIRIMARDESAWFPVFPFIGGDDPNYYINGFVTELESKGYSVMRRSYNGHNKRGLNKASLKDYAGAIEDYTKAIELNPNHASAYNNRGYAKAKLNDYAGAIRDFTKAIDIYPQDALAFYLRGVVKNELKDKQGALEDFVKAETLGYSDAYWEIKKIHEAEAKLSV